MSKLMFGFLHVFGGAVIAFTDVVNHPRMWSLLTVGGPAYPPLLFGVSIVVLLGMASMVLGTALVLAGSYRQS